MSVKINEAKCSLVFSFLQAWKKGVDWDDVSLSWPGPGWLG